MASKKTSINRQVTVSEMRYVNEETGEVEAFNVIESRDTDFNFEKIWLGHLLDSLEVIGNQKIKVLNWLLANRNADNLIIATQRIIAKKSGVSYPVVNRTIGALIGSGALASPQAGVYMLNPDCVFKGANKKRMNVLLRFTEIKEIKQEKPNKNTENQLTDKG